MGRTFLLRSGTAGEEVRRNGRGGGRGEGTAVWLPRRPRNFLCRVVRTASASCVVYWYCGSGAGSLHRRAQYIGGEGKESSANHPVRWGAHQVFAAQREGAVDLVPTLNTTVPSPTSHD